MSSLTLSQDTDTMSDPETNHAQLAAQVEALGRAAGGLADQQHADRLLRMMRRPGWTTRQEAQLVSAMVGHLHEQLASLHRAHDALLTAADQIGA